MIKAPVSLRYGLLVFLPLLFAALPACHHEPLIIDDLDTVCFGAQVLPVLQGSCGIAGCHDGSQEGFLAADYASIVRSVKSGDPRGSKLYQVITDINGEEMMPPDRPLTQEQRTIIQVWIAQDALETTCDTGNGGNGNTNNGNADSICFVQDVLPLFISNCAISSCHDGLSQGEEEETFALNSYSTILPYVEAFNPSSSDVYKAVNGAGEDLMPPPPKSPLSSA